MISYRFKRRAFLTAMSGGVGLKIMLRNMEAAAQTNKSPPRLLVTHWPVGIVAGQSDMLFRATDGSVGGSQGLQPFADAGLGADMTVVKGISTPGGVGGSHEGGTPMLVTGVPTRGTRAGQRETDDAYADGPSFEQVLLANAATNLKSPTSPLTYQNVACDTRTDHGEYSTKTLSYSANRQTPAGGSYQGPGQENAPLPPTLSPVTAYMNLFGNFVNPASLDPGEGVAEAAPVADAVLTNLASRRSILDFAKRELDLLRTAGPSAVRMRLDNNYNAILTMENAITQSIDNIPMPTGRGGAGGNMGMGGMGGRGGMGGGAGYGGAGGAGGRGGSGGGGMGGMGGSGGTGMGGMGGGPVVIGGPACTMVNKQPMSVMGKSDAMGGVGFDYTDPSARATDDAANVQAVGTAHFAVLKAAFICDVIRCGTFLWAPGTNHVGFKGLFPGQPNTIYQHHPQSHKIQTSHTIASATLTSLDPSAQFLFAVQRWFYARQAENLKDWKAARDMMGNSLLDYTVVPYVTEVRATQHERSSMPAMIIGGKALGFVHNKYQAGSYTVNQFWGTIAQAFGHTSTASPFAAPISGLWTRPA